MPEAECCGASACEGIQIVEPITMDNSSPRKPITLGECVEHLGFRIVGG